MSQDNVQLVFRGLDAFNRRDVDGYLALMEEDVEAVSRLATMEGGFHGHVGIRRWLANVFNVWPDVEAEIGEASAHADVTLIELRLRGHGAGSDIPLEWTVWQVAKWRQGKVYWWASFSVREEALEAVGVEE